MKITSQHGFTLIELIVVIVILAVISAISLPSFQSTIINNRMTTEINSLVTDLHLAKTEAIKRSRTVTICSANEALSECSGSADWGVNGWIVIDGDEVIKVASSITDSLNEVGVTGDEGKISFNRYGFTTSSARSFALCGPFGNDGVIKGAVVTNGGRIRNAADMDDNGIVEMIEFTNSGSEVSLSTTDMEC